MPLAAVCTHNKRCPHELMLQIARAEEGWGSLSLSAMSPCLHLVLVGGVYFLLPCVTDTRTLSGLVRMLALLLTQ